MNTRKYDCLQGIFPTVGVVGADEIGVGVRGKVEDGAGADSERSSTVKVGYPI